MFASAIREVSGWLLRVAQLKSITICPELSGIFIIFHAKFVCICISVFISYCAIFSLVSVHCSMPGNTKTVEIFFTSTTVTHYFFTNSFSISSKVLKHFSRLIRALILAMSCLLGVIRCLPLPFEYHHFSFHNDNTFCKLQNSRVYEVYNFRREIQNIDHIYYSKYHLTYLLLFRPLFKLPSVYHNYSNTYSCCFAGLLLPARS